MIPGDQIPLNEDDLLKIIGREVALKEHEQKKRLVLIQAYGEVEAELTRRKEQEAATAGPEIGPAEEPKLLNPEDVVIGNP